MITDSGALARSAPAVLAADIPGGFCGVGIPGTPIGDGEPALPAQYYRGSIITVGLLARRRDAHQPHSHRRRRVVRGPLVSSPPELLRGPHRIYALVPYGTKVATVRVDVVTPQQPGRLPDVGPGRAPGGHPDERDDHGAGGHRTPRGRARVIWSNSGSAGRGSLRRSPHLPRRVPVGAVGRDIRPACPMDIGADLLRAQWVPPLSTARPRRPRNLPAPALRTYAVRRAAWLVPAWLLVLLGTLALPGTRTASKGAWGQPAAGAVVAQLSGTCPAWPNCRACRRRRCSCRGFPSRLGDRARRVKGRGARAPAGARGSGPGGVDLPGRRRLDWLPSGIAGCARCRRR